jgi:hypothetical protein
MRIIAIILGILAVCIAIVVLMGMRLPKEHRIENSAEIGAPPLAVWTQISDVAGSPTWRSDVKRVEMLDQKRWREYGKTGSVVFRLALSEPMQRRVVVIADRNLPFTGSWMYTLEPLPNGNTKVTIVEDATVFNPVYRFVGHYFIGERTSIDRYLHDLQKSFAYGKGAQA